MQHWNRTTPEAARRRVGPLVLPLSSMFVAPNCVFTRVPSAATVAHSGAGTGLWESWLVAVPLVAHHSSGLHHEPHGLGGLHLREGVAGHCHQVRLLAGLDGPHGLV